MPHTDTLTDAAKTARAAAEYRANIGERPSMLDALDPEYLDDAPFDPEAEKWEQEGRLEMYETLFGGGEV